jgi:archaellum component FlaC
MRRISHDLPGVTARIAKLSDELATTAAETQHVWRDAKGQAFMQQHISEVAPTINQLVSALSRSIEIFEDISKKVQDPERV